MGQPGLGEKERDGARKGVSAYNAFEYGGHRSE